MTQRSGKTAHAGGWSVAVIAVVAALILSGVAATGAPVTGGTVTIGLQADPTMLDPHASAAAATYLLGSLNVFESLLYQSPDGKFNPWLATSYRISPDGKTFTFVLRQDVRFSDGTRSTRTR
ncbi:MAG TPA: ABC transporter substrate-binding protein [bacterium]|nr:ABC transporter substrate-binding protein [bacterium]